MISHEKLWCRECEGWTSGNDDIDKFIKDTIYYSKKIYSDYDKYCSYYNYLLFLQWVPFDKFSNIKQIGEGGFAKVYSATWNDGNAKYIEHNGNWKKLNSEPIEVALKRLNGSQNISAEYLNELKIHWHLYNMKNDSLKFFGITKDPETKEFMIIMQLANRGNLRCILSSSFNNMLWKDKIKLLMHLTGDLKNLHRLGYSHKDFHCGNILQNNHNYDGDYDTYISDFGLSGPLNEQKLDDKVYGVLPYIAPEVLNGDKYRSSSDIYSFGIIMVELSSGKPPFHERKHDTMLALDICNGLRPEFGKGTPEIYKKLAYWCMNANHDQRPTANELNEIFHFFDNSIRQESYQEKEEFGYKGKEIKDMFKEADKEIPNNSLSYKKDPDAIYTSRAFTFGNLPKPVNSSIIKSYLNDGQDSLVITNSFLR